MAADCHHPAFAGDPVVRADEQLLQRLQEQAQRASRQDRAIPGRFLTGAEQQLAIHAARQAGVEVSFDGGWEGAERMQACFHPSWEEPVFTAEWADAAWNGRFAHCDHRDLLGSLMALGMDRALFGDLIVQGDHAYLYALQEMAMRLPLEWTQAGHVPLKVTLMDEPPVIEAPRGVLLKDTVASLRLDCVLASGLKASRSRAAEMIRQGLVSVDHVPEERVDRMLTEGQLLSVRGFGRIRLTGVGDPTRKDRLPVTLEVFSRT